MLDNLDWVMEIVSRAIFDWRKLISAEAWKVDKLFSVTTSDHVPNKNCNFEELRAFFKSEWCYALLTVSDVSVSGEYILEQLEKELTEAIKADDCKRECKNKSQTAKVFA